MAGRGETGPSVSTIEALAIGWRAAVQARRRANAERRAQLRARAASKLTLARRPALSVAGLTGMTLAAWTVSTAVGLLVTGVSCFVLEWLTSE
jgi:hypothetical protein